MTTLTLPTIDEFRCPHGFGREYRGPSGLMAAPWDVCGCCGTTYFYIDSGFAGTAGSGGRSWTPRLCAQCGGRYIAWGVTA